jgi:hypothetical protein
MDKETIKYMINNSTWKNPAKKTVYKFANENALSINGENHLHYSIHSRNDKIELLIDSAKCYNIEYVNDFTLKLYNNNESFIIMPE